MKGPDRVGSLADRAVHTLRTDERIARLGEMLLIITGIVIVAMGFIAVRAAVAIDTVTALRMPFAVAGGGLLLAGGLTALRLRERLVTAVLAGLTGATFAMFLAELSVREPGASDRYDSLWVPSGLGAVLIIVRLLDGGFRGDLD